MKPMNLLLVDDESAFLETISKRLTKRSVRHRTAGDGNSALEVLAADDAIDVVVLDVKMPGMDGVETLKEIKRRFPLKEVVMLTGHATVETAIDGMKLGAFDYLMKPCDIDVLLEKVREAVDHKRAHEEKITEARIREIAQRRV